MPAPRTWLATADEAEVVARLLVDFRDWNERDWPSANAFLAIVERLFEDRNTDFLLGAPHDDAPPAGVCVLRYRLSVWTAADDCWLEDLWVGDQARGVGLGRALVEAACARAESRGCRRIELDASEANPAALELYQGLGFTSGKLAGARDLFLQRVLSPLN